MNRKFFLVLPLVLAVAVTGAFASGKKEETAPAPAPWYYGPGPWGGPGWKGHGWGMMPHWQAPGDWPKFSEDKVTVTGKLYFENLIHPALKASDKEYELQVPHWYLYQLDLEEGQNVTVEGYTVTNLPFEKDTDTVHVWVTKAVIDGKEYDLERYGRGPMMGPGMMGPRGRRGWW